MTIHTSMYPANYRRSIFFRLSYLEYEFMIANLVRLNLVVLKISETREGVLC